jgi:Fe-S oxidoreductase
MIYEELLEGITDCILCGRCLEVCTLFQSSNEEEYSPSGKAYLLLIFSNHKTHYLKTMSES